MYLRRLGAIVIWKLHYFPDRSAALFREDAMLPSFLARSDISSNSINGRDIDDNFKLNTSKDGAPARDELSSSILY